MAGALKLHEVAASPKEKNVIHLLGKIEGRRKRR